MKRGRPRLDGLDDILPGRSFVRECIRSLAPESQSVGAPLGKRGAPQAVPTGRDLDFHSRYKQGATLAEIGALYGITRERVRQRLKKWWGFTREDGGASFRAITAVMDKGAADRARNEARCMKIFGVPEDVFRGITGLESSKGAYAHLKRKTHPIIVAYINQARSARARGISWEFTLATWWAVWTDSGHWAERGRGEGYCMARWADSGPYSADNVYICTNSANIKDGYIVNPADARVAKRRARAAANA